MTREEAKLALRSWGVPKGREYEAVMTLIPELRESEDERIRKELVNFLQSPFIKENLTDEKVAPWLAYLEKRKEQSSQSFNQKQFFTKKDSTPFEEELFLSLRAVKETKPSDEEIWLNVKEQLTPVLLSLVQKERKPILEVFGFKVGDKVRLKDGDGRPHIIKSFEEVEGIHGPNFYHVEFEDNSARDGIYPGEEYPNGFYTQMKKFEEEQKTEWNEEDEEALDMCLDAIPKKWKTKSGILLTKWLKDNIHPQSKSIRLAEWSDDFDKEIENIHKRYPEVSFAKLTRIAYHFSKWANRCKDIEWSEEDESCWNLIWDILDGSFTASKEGYKKAAAWFLKNCHKGTKSPRPQPKQEWSEEDKENLENIRIYLLHHGEDAWADTITKLKSLRPQTKQEWSEEDEKMLKSIVYDFAAGHKSSIGQDKWLKSLRPQPKRDCKDCAMFLNGKCTKPHWEPSEEQMKQLENAMMLSEFGPMVTTKKQYPALESLYNDLKKLL